jgi:hypothetical protein
MGRHPAFLGLCPRHGSQATARPALVPAMNGPQQGIVHESAPPVAQTSGDSNRIGVCGMHRSSVHDLTMRGQSSENIARSRGFQVLITCSGGYTF